VTVVVGKDQLFDLVGDHAIASLPELEREAFLSQSHRSGSE
jgi:hypothetical protein